MAKWAATIIFVIDKNSYIMRQEIEAYEKPTPSDFAEAFDTVIRISTTPVKVVGASGEQLNQYWYVWLNGVERFQVGSIHATG